MRTNFNHLREYPKYFEIAKTAEKQILNAKNQAEFKMAGNLMRQLIEGLIGELVAKHGLEPKDFGDALKKLKQGRIMHKASINHLYRIKDLGNICSHPKDTISEDELHEMYSLVYEESYRLVKYYLTDQAVNDYKKAQREGQIQNHDSKQSYHNQNKNVHNENQNVESKSEGWIAALIGIAVVVVCLCLVL